MKLVRVASQVFDLEAIVTATVSGEAGGDSPQHVAITMTNGAELKFTGANAVLVWNKIKGTVEDWGGEEAEARFGFA